LTGGLSSDMVLVFLVFVSSWVGEVAVPIMRSDYDRLIAVLVFVHSVVRLGMCGSYDTLGNDARKLD
jgi:hypothetical protein